MPTVLQFRRGTTTQNNALTGAVGEITVDTTLDMLRLHDGSAAGGFGVAIGSKVDGSAINITASANNSTDETTYPTFVDGATGAQGIETDTGLTYNPSTGTLTSTIFAGTANAAKYADLAEMYAADESYESGTVLVLGGESEVTSCKEMGDPRVLGIVSTDPAYLMNSGLDTEHVVPVALTGRVFAKVTGKVSKGDLMVTSEVEGHAESWQKSRVYSFGYRQDMISTPSPGSILGKAVAGKDGIGEGIIEIVVGIT